MKKFKLITAAALALALAFALGACKKEEPAAPAPTGTLEISAVCADAPEGTLTFSLTDADNNIERVTVKVNGEAQSIELKAGTWVVRTVTAPKTADGEWVFKAVESFSVQIADGKTAKKVVELTLNEGVSKDAEVTEEETGQAASGTGSTPVPSDQGATNPGNSGGSNGGNSGGSTGGSTGGSNGGGNGGSTQPVHQHSWVAQTEQRWVVDRDAWSEQVPAGEILVCSCGAMFDYSTQWDSHNKQIMLGGGASHSYSFSTVYDTVYHDAEGHYEDVTVGYRCDGCGAVQ